MVLRGTGPRSWDVLQPEGIVRNSTNDMSDFRSNFKRALFLMILLCCGPLHAGQITCQKNPPQEVVEDLWRRGATGELLIEKGRKDALSLFVKGAGESATQEVRVFSEYYGVNMTSVDGNHATVQVEYADLGIISSNLTYRPAAQSSDYKTSFEFRLVSTPAHMRIYSPDGRTIVEEKEIPNTAVWQIEESPIVFGWTTVNAAIRYTLEKRSVTKDPQIRKNADETISKLLKLH
jgi:hypothetical protein